MPSVALLSLVALLGVLVGAVGVLALRISEREQARELPTESVTTSAAATASTVALLRAIPQTVVVINEGDTVERASAHAYSWGLVLDGKIAHPQIQGMISQVRARGEICDQELTLPRSALTNAGTMRLQVRVAPLEGSNIIILAEDRTKERRLEETRRDFFTNISHELKTPVGALALLAETVVDNADDPATVQHFSAQMGIEARRLVALTQEIIELSRLQDPDNIGEMQRVEIDSVVAEALERVRVEAKARNITLVCGGTPGLAVYGDEALLITAVRNLLDNAVRYSSPDSQVSIGISNDDALVRIAVVDHGIGIDPDMRERVFERFFRADEARSRETGGTGLGLSIVKHVANDHGGQVSVWSEPGRGSTFTLILPEAYRQGVLVDNIPAPNLTASATLTEPVSREGQPAASDPINIPEQRDDEEST